MGRDKGVECWVVVTQGAGVRQPKFPVNWASHFTSSSIVRIIVKIH